MESYGTKKATISQVAVRAGVSITAVSLYLAGNRKVCSEATAKRIDEAVSELNYQPNPLAGSNFNKQRRTIGLLASDDLERGFAPFVVYNMKTLSGILQVAHERDFAVLAYPYRVYMECRHRAVLDGRVDGLLFYGSCEHEIVRRMWNAGMPVVCFGIPERVHQAAGVVHNDEAAISNLAMGHLWDLGHRRIAHLAGPYHDCYRYPIGPTGSTEKLREPAERVSAARYEAGKLFMEQRNAYDPVLFSAAHPWRDALLEGTLDQWWSLRERPTAVYCANDYLAWGVIDWAQKHGVHVPKDLAVVGVDNIDMPNKDRFLTSVDICVEQQGRQAINLLMDILNGIVEPPVVRSVPPIGLIVRSSTVPTD